MSLASAVKRLVFLSKKKDVVTLRPLNWADFLCIHSWLIDPEITELTFVSYGPKAISPMLWTDEMVRRYIHGLIMEPTRLSYAIEVDGKHVGNIGLKDYKKNVEKSEIFIEIGESRCRHKGIGTAAMYLFLDHVFFKLGLQKVQLEVLEYNQAAIRVYQRLGFVMTQPTGWHYSMQGQYFRVLGMCLTRDRWRGLRQQVVLSEQIALGHVEGSED